MDDIQTKTQKELFKDVWDAFIDIGLDVQKTTEDRDQWKERALEAEKDRDECMEQALESLNLFEEVRDELKDLAVKAVKDRDLWKKQALETHNDRNKLFGKLTRAQTECDELKKDRNFWKASAREETGS